MTDSRADEPPAGAAALPGTVGGPSPEGEREGVVKYDARHTPAALDPALAPLAAALAAWRHPLRALGWLGQEEGRYGGYGFGNLSARLPDDLATALGLDPAHHPFLVTGSQTGARPHLDLAHFALVERHDPTANRLWSHGPLAASSESLTHAALYTADPNLGAVFHVHAPELWRARHTQGLQETPEGVAYGTPEMATAVTAARSRSAGTTGVLAMAGHEDGLLAWAPDPASAGKALLQAAGWW